MSQVKEILKKNPAFDVNWWDRNTWTGLHHACEKGHDSLVSVLLGHPGIDVNQKDYNGCTPFMMACYFGKTYCVRLLLKDAKVEVNEPAKNGCTPSWAVTFEGHSDIIQWWIASGREMDLGKPRKWESDVVWAAERRKHPKVVALLESFRDYPVETRRAARIKVGWSNEAAAEVFALTVFVSDGLLEIANQGEHAMTPAPAARFFRITRALPLELQMVLCHRVVGSTLELIPGRDSEVAFMNLAAEIAAVDAAAEESALDAAGGGHGTTTPQITTRGRRALQWIVQRVTSAF